MSYLHFTISSFYVINNTDSHLFTDISKQVKGITMEEYEIKPEVSREALARDGNSALICLVGGVIITIIMFGARFPVLGIILAGVSLGIGIVKLFSENREDSKRGFVLTAAGVMGLLVRFGPVFMKPFAQFALLVGAIGLLTTGIINGIRFLLGLKSRL